MPETPEANIGRDMKIMRHHLITAGSAYLPKGIAFEIDDLGRVQEWANNHNVRMVIGLDHGIDGEAYEEVITLYAGMNSSCFLMIWRNARAVFAQLLVGRPLKYQSVSHLLESIVARQQVDEADNTMVNRNGIRRSPSGAMHGG
jgi:hypothetical protein